MHKQEGSSDRDALKDKVTLDISVLKDEQEKKGMF